MDSNFLFDVAFYVLKLFFKYFNVLTQSQTDLSLEMIGGFAR